MTNQTDYFFLFASAAAAQADPIVGAYWDTVNLIWRGDVCFPGLKVVTSQAVVNGISSLTGFWIMISSPGPNATLAGSANCVLATDRIIAAQGGSFVIASSMTAAGHQNLHFSPVPAGSQYAQPLAQ